MSEEIFTFSAVGNVVEDPAKWVDGTMSTTGDPWVEMPALLFYEGTHKGKRYTGKDLDLMHEQFQAPHGELDWTVPLQLDHDDSSDKTRGHLRNTWRTGKQLFGTVRYVGEKAVRNAKNGLYKKLSLGIYGRSKRIREVSVTPFPQLAGASTYSESEDTMATNATEPKEEAPTKVEPVNTQSADSQIAEIRREFAEKTTTQEDRLAALEARNAELEKVIRFKELTGEIDRFSEAGKTLPVMREAELALVETFSDDQMELYRAYKEAQPQLVSEEVLGSQDPELVEKFRQSKAGGEDAEERRNRLAAYGRMKGNSN